MILGLNDKEMTTGWNLLYLEAQEFDSEWRKLERVQLSLARSLNAEFKFWFPHSQCGLVRHLTFLCLVFSSYNMQFIIPTDTLTPRSLENSVDYAVMVYFLTLLGSSTSLCQILVFHVIHSLSSHFSSLLSCSHPLFLPHHLLAKAQLRAMAYKALLDVAFSL